MDEPTYVMRWRIRDESGGTYCIYPVMVPRGPGSGWGGRMRWLFSLFAGVRNSTKGVINTEELYKAILGSFGVSSVAGLAVLILESVNVHAADIFPDAHNAAVYTFAAAIVMDLLRRRADGHAAIVLPPGATVPATGALAPPPIDVPTVPPEAIPPEGLAPPVPPRGGSLDWDIADPLDTRGEFLKSPKPAQGE